jgi:hypothetical protein
MKNLMLKFLEAKTLQEIDMIIFLNWDSIKNNSMLLSMAKTSKKRILRINREKIKSWGYMAN